MNPSRLLISLGLVLQSATLRAQAPPGIDPAWTYLGKSRVVEAPRAVVVAGSPIASEVGRRILEQGGNAVDAAVAVAFALAVVHPEAGNIGGGGFLVYRQSAGDVHTLDFRETAPATARRDMYVGPDGKATKGSLWGHLASGVPGSVAGLAEAHRRYGKLPWATLLDPAIGLARDGFVVDEYRHESIFGDSTRLRRFPATEQKFYPGGLAPAIGATFRQPDLARTLTTIAEQGSAGFYQGWVADSLVAEMKRGGGLISLADLHGYRPIWREPVRFSYRGYTFYSMAPASSGGVTLGLILHIMEGFQPLPPFGSVELMHLQAEAMRRAFLERNKWLGDPAFVENPITRLLSADFATRLRRQIDRHHASKTSVSADAHEGSSTTHVSIVDSAGNAVALTTTLNSSYGSGVTVPGAGFLLNNEMDDFNTVPGQPDMYGAVTGERNAVAPGKRMLSSMSPTVVVDPSGRLFMVLGTPGGTTIMSQLYQVVTNVIDHGMTLADAVAAPRMHHQAVPDTLRLEKEPSFPAATVAGLRELGHAVRFGSYMGDVEAIIRTPAGWQGVSDPRRGGGGSGY